MAEAFARQPPVFSGWDVSIVELRRDSADLDRRIVSRVGAMLKDGLVDEVRSLLDQGLGQNASAARAIGYREVISMIEGSLRMENLAAEITKNTRALVKKQQTWFRTQLPAHETITL
jgi:tRNA dimethylallyltransferase